jgi:hypothetical protein
VGADRQTRAIEEDAAGAGRTLVDGGDNVHVFR